MAVLLVLTLLAAGVWWRVLHHEQAAGASAAVPRACVPAASAAVLTVRPATVRLRVFNATGRRGLAGDVGTELRRRGFVVAATGNDPLAASRPVAGVGEIRYGSAAGVQALLVSLHATGMQLIRDARTDGVLDVVLGPGYRGLATGTELARGKAAMVARARTGAPARC